MKKHLLFLVVATLSILALPAIAGTTKLGSAPSVLPPNAVLLVSSTSAPAQNPVTMVAVARTSTVGIYLQVRRFAVNDIAGDAGNVSKVMPVYSHGPVWQAIYREYRPDAKINVAYHKLTNRHVGALATGNPHSTTFGTVQLRRT